MLALVLTSMSVCFPNDVDCGDDHRASKVELTKEKESKTNYASSKESHHCVCSLSCHNMFFDLYSDTPENIAISIFESNPVYLITFYPQITLSLEKPPTV